jgi:hypothetical protein
MSSPAPSHAAPIALWRAARELICTIFNLFGEPEEIAADHTLTAKTYHLLLSWLRTGEAMLRHLIFIEAAALNPVSCGPPASSRHSSKRERKLMEFFADKPESWRVTFRCFSSSPVHGGSVIAPCAMTKGASAVPSVAFGDTSPARGGGKQFYDAWPLAERAEALLRAFNDPAPYAKRLARRLRAAPSRARAVLPHCENLIHRIGDDIHAELTVCCDNARALFSNSS